MLTPMTTAPATASGSRPGDITRTGGTGGPPGDADAETGKFLRKILTSAIRATDLLLGGQNQLFKMVTTGLT